MLWVEWIRAICGGPSAANANRNNPELLTLTAAARHAREQPPISRVTTSSKMTYIG